MGSSPQRQRRPSRATLLWSGDAEGSESEDAASGSDGEPVSQEDLAAAGDQAFEFVKAAAAGEAETACSPAMDPTTGSGMSGANLESCVAGFEESAEEGSPVPAPRPGPEADLPHGTSP